MAEWTGSGGAGSRMLPERSKEEPDMLPDPAGNAPNVVMIVFDDLGFADFGCYGSEIATPSIDKLAEQGLRYNNFHVTAICSPTRACLLTGRNHHAVGMGGFPHFPLRFPGYTGRIPKSAAMLPRLLRDAGYSTFALGKWHLTPRYEEGPAGPFDRWPLGAGFERYYGFLGGAANHWTPELVRDNGFVEPPLSPDDGYHLSEDLATQAIRFVQDQQQAAPDRPFFLYLATGATHYPHHVSSGWSERYRHQFDDGWNALRHRTFQRQQEFGVIPSSATLTERPSWVAPWDAISAGERRLLSRQMEVYAAFLTHADAQVGRLLDFLSHIGVMNNTLVIALSDNGTSGEGGAHGSHNYPARVSGGTEDELSHIENLGGHQVYNHYASGWAWAGNTPFRLWKSYTWLGGVRVPLIVRWPAGIAVDHQGEVRPQFCHAIDLMPTILEVARVDVPDAVDGVSQQPLDGKSLLETFSSRDLPGPRRTQYFEMMGSRSIYHEGWKATTDHAHEGDDVEGSHDFDMDRWLLFNLEVDFSEAHDVAENNPDRLSHMTELWRFEAGRNQVLPLMTSSQRIQATQPPRYADTRRFVYRPGGGPILTPSLAAGFCLISAMDVPGDRQAGGIICAQGDWHNGWACYFMDGHLVVAFNFGGTLERIVTRQVTSLGRHEIAISYLPVSQSHDSAAVAVDGREVGSVTVSSDRLRRSALWMDVQATKLLIGRDEGSPVCDDYQPPFPFSGEIHHVQLEVPKPSARTNDPPGGVSVAQRYD